MKCSDIIFAVLNESLNRIEPIVYGFTQEAHILNSIVETISISERTEIIKRGYLAKEMTYDMLLETKNKLKFISKIKAQGKRSSFFSIEMMLQLQYLKRRLQLQHDFMVKSQDLIGLALDKFGHFIDNDLTKYNKQLNRILLTFAFIEIVTVPFVLAGGFFGMNVRVPMQDWMAEDGSNSIFPFVYIISGCLVASTLLMIVFRLFNFI